MLMALMAMYFFGGAGGDTGAVLTSSGVKDLQERVEFVIEDDARRDSATELLKDLGSDVKAFEKTFASSGKQLNKLYRTHGVATEDALAVFDDLNAHWAEGQEQALNARFALRDMLSEEEWSAIFDTDASPHTAE
jgi:hypothetical protein